MTADQRALSAATPTGRNLAARGLAGVAVATVFSAGAGYIVMLMAGRDLGAAGYESFTVFWGLFFTFVGIATGLMQETTRAVRTRADARSPAPAQRLASPFRTAVGVGSVLAVVIAATSPLWASHVLHHDTVLGVALLAAATLSVTAQAALWGALSGSGRWPLYAVALALDAALRLALAAVAVAAGYGLVGFAVATVAGAVSWAVIVAVFPSARASLSLVADVPAPEFLRRSGHAMAAAAATSVLIVGFPVLLRATTTGAPSAHMGTLMFAVMLTRAPLLVPLTSFQSAIVVYFIERGAAVRRALMLPVAAVLGVGAAGAALAWWIGPWVIGLVGKGFDIDGVVLAGLTVGAAATGMLMLTGCAALSRSHHRAYALGWWAATALAIALLAAPLAVDLRTVLALIAGPLAGCVVHLVALSRADSKRRQGALGRPTTNPL